MQTSNAVESTLVYIVDLAIIHVPITFTGNLSKVDCVSDFEYDLYVRPDTFNSRFRVWFYFTVENVRVDQVQLFHRTKYNYYN